jgi:hypothetical protein
MNCGTDWEPAQGIVVLFNYSRMKNYFLQNFTPHSLTMKFILIKEYPTPPCGKGSAMLENIIVIAAVAASLIYVVSRFVRKGGSGGSSCGCSSCGSCPSTNGRNGCKPH